MWNRDIWNWDVVLHCVLNYRTGVSWGLDNFPATDAPVFKHPMNTEEILTFNNLMFPSHRGEKNGFPSYNLVHCCSKVRIWCQSPHILHDRDGRRPAPPAVTRRQTGCLTVTTICLPGFGSQFLSVNMYHNQDWWMKKYFWISQWSPMVWSAHVLWHYWAVSLGQKTVKYLDTCLNVTFP